MTQRDEPLVSIVTPVHNTAEFVSQCIESVLAQDYGHWEYVISDNWSSDGSSEIVAKYAAADRRIRVVRPPSLLQQLPNFNYALAQVSDAARYCKMVLADDWIFPSCVSQMVAVAEAHPTVGIVASYSLRETVLFGSGLPFPSHCVPGRELARRQLLGELFLFGSPTTLLYRQEVVRERQPFFTEASLHADTEAGYEILRSHDFGFVHQVLSFVRRQPESISGSRRNLNWEALDLYIILRKYGREFLGDAAYETRLRDYEDAYYHILAEGIVQRNRALWRYHRDGLAAAGIELDRAKLARALVRAGLDLARHPRAALRVLAGQFRSEQ